LKIKKVRDLTVDIKNIKKEVMIMNKLALENRIALLLGRGKDNGNIVRKLRRRLRKLESES
jgi:hypothetical protein